MVSTRGLKLKFSVGEKVLCYEPDPLKAKVLYNSKVLKILDEKESGKKELEFLIHFSGWNSTWDRYVTEDFILKDTDENRRLQKELAEKAQLTPGGNLYKRERRSKKRHRNISSSNSTSSQNENTYDQMNDQVGELSCTTNSSTDDMSSCSDERELKDENINTEFPPTVRCVTPTVPLSGYLKNILFTDQKQIKHSNLLVSLPAAPTVIEILDGFYRHEATMEINAFPNKTHSQYENSPPTLEDLTRSLNCLEQVVDGVRIYFDFMLKDILLYNNEVKQFEFYQKNYQRPISGFRTVICDDIDISCKKENDSDEPGDDSEPDEKKSLPCFDSDSEKRSAALMAFRCRRQNRRELSSDTIMNGNNINGHSTDSLGHKRLDSVSSVDSTISSLAGGGASSVSSASSPYLLNLDGSRSKMIEQLKRWTFVPESVIQSSPPLPSVIYGAVHLTRLLLKLPGVLTESALTDEKLEFLIEKLKDLADYVRRHEEWFRSNIYVNNTFS